MEGKRAVITDFIYENQASMYRLAFAYTHCREAALDIVQDTVVQALTHASSLKAAEAVKAASWSMKASRICAATNGSFWSKTCRKTWWKTRISARNSMFIGRSAVWIPNCVPS